MKTRHIGFGLFLIVTGIIWTFSSMGLLHTNIFYALFKLWPLALVVIGVSIVWDHPAVRVTAWLGFIAVLLVFGSVNQNKSFFGPFSKNTGEGTSNIKIEKPVETKSGNLKLDLGAVNFELGETDASLLEANASGEDIRNSVEFENGKERVSARIFRKSIVIPEPRSYSENLKIGLNKDVAWDLDINAGAVNGSLDLSGLQIGNVNMDAGAGKFKIIFGELSKHTSLKIDAGASSFEVVIPKNTGLKLKLDGGLNNFEYNGIQMNKNGKEYISENYLSAERKIDMDVDMGVGKLWVEAK